MRITEATHLELHIDNVIRDMDKAGQMWAKIQCYINKVSSMEEAYVIGYISALEGIREYLLFNLDKPKKLRYTPRKAHKK